MSNILVLHGPNLNLLGTREPEHYGRVTLEEINERAARIAKDAGFGVIARQSNAEHEIVNVLQDAVASDVRFVVFNPAAYTHTSVAIRDAMIASDIPFVEVHLSNVFSREEFRHHSYLADIAQGVICGFGVQGYEFAMQVAVNHLRMEQEGD
ncbi:MAG: type II 3-dehydroquinate dehydratase [Acidiferrobacterales bacterium]|nr:type II 3-dehydroquinate dehydratase [Acidiferrobacterales bacterium]